MSNVIAYSRESNSSHRICKLCSELLGRISFCCSVADVPCYISSEFHRLVKDMRDLRETAFNTSFRMSPDMFDKLLTKISSRISESDLRRRDIITPAERLTLTLR